MMLNHQHSGSSLLKFLENGSFLVNVGLINSNEIKNLDAFINAGASNCNC